MTRRQKPPTRDQRIAAVRSLAEGKAKRVKALDPYEDDHILCAPMLVDGVRICFPWCGWEIAAAALYYDESARARACLAKHAQAELDELDELDDCLFADL